MSTPPYDKKLSAAGEAPAEVTVEQAAKLLHVSPVYVDELVRAGHLVYLASDTAGAGEHLKLLARDAVMAYSRACRERQVKGLDEVIAASECLGLYDQEWERAVSMPCGRDADSVTAGVSMRTESEEDFFRRVRSYVRAGRGERRTRLQVTLSFESVGAFLALLTPVRYALYEALKQVGRPERIEALAVALQRDVASVNCDVRALADAGLLQLRDARDEHGRQETEVVVVPAQVVFSL